MITKFKLFLLISTSLIKNIIVEGIDKNNIKYKRNRLLLYMSNMRFLFQKWLL